MYSGANVLKVISIVPIVLLYNVLIFASETNVDMPISEMLAGSLFGSLEVGNLKSFALVIEKMFYIIIFNLLFGTYIYKDFIVSSVYLFSRLKNRKTWFFKKSTELLLFAACYAFLFLGTLLLLCIYRSQYSLDTESVKMLVLLWFAITLFLTFVTLLINLFAIRYGSNVAFIIVYIALMGLVTLSLASRTFSIIEENPYYLLFNPVAAIILNMIDNLTMQLVASLYYCLLICIVILVGAVYINRLDIALIDNESV